MNKNRFYIYLIVAALLFVFGWVIVSQPKESKISFEFPAASTVGDEIRVPLKVNVTEPINAAEFYFTFPSDLLEVKSIDQTNSFFQLWITNSPKFDNQSGAFELAGGLPKPGLIGEGLVATVVFKTLKTGSGQIVLNLEKSRILANDGLGTQITTAVFSPIEFAVR